MRNIEITDRTADVDREALAAHVDVLGHPPEAVERGARLTAGRALRSAAKTDPRSVEPHADTLQALLSADSGPLRLAGAVCLAELATHDPDRVAETVPELVDVLETATAPTVAAAALRALGRVGEADPATVASADPSAAAALRDGVPLVRDSVVTGFSGALVAQPSNYPETIRAAEDVLNEADGVLRKRTAIALAAVAEADPDALRSVADARDLVQALAASTFPLQDDALNRAAETFRQVTEE